MPSATRQQLRRYVAGELLDPEFKVLTATANGAASPSTIVDTYRLKSSRRGATLQDGYALRAGGRGGSDSFNRADSALTLGTADTGEVWTAHSGVWGINGLQAYHVSGAAMDLASIAAGRNGLVAHSLIGTLGYPADVAMAAFRIRADDPTTFLYARPYTDRLVLAKSVGGLLGNLATLRAPFVSGAVLPFMLQMYEALLTLYIGGTFLGSYTLAGGDATTFNDATKTYRAGLCYYLDSPTATPAFPARWDDFAYDGSALPTDRVRRILTDDPSTGTLTVDLDYITPCAGGEDVEVYGAVNPEAIERALNRVLARLVGEQAVEFAGTALQQYPLTTMLPWLVSSRQLVGIDLRSGTVASDYAYAPLAGAAAWDVAAGTVTLDFGPDRIPTTADTVRVRAVRDFASQAGALASDGDTVTIPSIEWICKETALELVGGTWLERLNTIREGPYLEQLIVQWRAECDQFRSYYGPQPSYPLFAAGPTAGGRSILW